MTEIRAFRDNRDLSRFEAQLADGLVAFKPYRLGRDHTIAFRHAVVPASHTGEGVAARLNGFAREQARKAGLTIVPSCPFIED